MAFLLCGPGWCVHKSDVQNKWHGNKHIHMVEARPVNAKNTRTYTRTVPDYEDYGLEVKSRVKSNRPPLPPFSFSSIARLAR